MKATNITLTKQDYGICRVGYFFGTSDAKSTPKQRWRYFKDVKKADEFMRSIKTLRIFGRTYIKKKRRKK